ncbi:hypothetical protein HY479_03475 [Candidatus Uhrbacteria bacterium]|nr:hypothetical protein [Candidatus Uhrbacteria bacterium]
MEFDRIVRPKLIVPRRRIPMGKPGDPVDLLMALKNVEAELGYVEGAALVDRHGADLSSILDDLLDEDAQRKLLQAVRAMELLHAPRIPSVTVHSRRPRRKDAWDLDRLERTFRDAVDRITPGVSLSLSSVEQDATFITPAARLVCLWSSLLLLGAECVLRKTRARTRKNSTSAA